MYWSAFHYYNEIPEVINLQIEKGLVWLIVQEVSVQDWVARLLWAVVRATYHSENV
jgi:hypothetical protein